MSYVCSTDPGQTARFATSDPGLHCLSVSLLKDFSHKWEDKTTSNQFARWFEYEGRLKSSEPKNLTINLRILA